MGDHFEHERKAKKYFKLNAITPQIDKKIAKV